MLPTPNTGKISYVYHHIHPETYEVHYIGQGTGGRAWSCSTSGSRSTEHATWLSDLFLAGFTMADIVLIVAQGLTKSQAHTLEKAEIVRHQGAYLFNGVYGKHSLVLSKSDIEIAIELRRQQVSYDRIGQQLNVSTMTIYRALNGQTEGYRHVAN